MSLTRRSLIAAAGPLLAQTARGSKLNLLMITNDQHRADALGCYGNPVIKTPRLDQLAREGTLFENHFVQAPQCVPSRASLHTGRYPHTHRTPSNAYLLPETEQTLPKILGSAGWDTAAVGEMPFAPQYYTGGFGKILASGAEYTRFLQSKGWGDPSAKRPEGRFQAVPVPWPAEVDETAFYAGEACRYLEAHRSSPFFLHINFRRPHHPFDPPAPYDTMYRGARFPPSYKRKGEMDTKPPGQAAALKNSVGFDLTTMTEADLDLVKSYYYGMVSLNDRFIGVVLDRLEELKLEGNTVVIFNADHGEMLGDHGLLFKGSYMYDQVLRVPLIVRAPGVKARTRVHALVEEIDVLPTILDLLQVEVPLGVQGSSLLKNPGKRFVHAEFPTVKMIRSRDWKLVHYPNQPYGELYDLQADPHELTNLFPNPAFAVNRAEMEASLADWLIASQDPKLAPTK